MVLHWSVSCNLVGWDSSCSAYLFIFRPCIAGNMWIYIFFCIDTHTHSHSRNVLWPRKRRMAFFKKNFVGLDTSCSAYLFILVFHPYLGIYEYICLSLSLYTNTHSWLLKSPWSNKEKNAFFFFNYSEFILKGERNLRTDVLSVLIYRM